MPLLGMVSVTTAMLMIAWETDQESYSEPRPRQTYQRPGGYVHTADHHNTKATTTTLSPPVRVLANDRQNEIGGFFREETVLLRLFPNLSGPPTGTQARMPWWSGSPRPTCAVQDAARHQSALCASNRRATKPPRHHRREQHGNNEFPVRSATKSIPPHQRQQNGRAADPVR